jgi:DNA-binding NarL/FixJ family response regulator
MHNNVIKLYIVDDHQVVVEGIRSLLQNEDTIEIVGHANNAEKCLQYFKNQSAHVILMDISLPDTDGIDLSRMILEKHPKIKILALSTFNQGTYVRKMMEAGASGYLLKNTGKQELLKAIETVFNGEKYMAFEVNQALKYENEQQNKIPKLTKREKEVLINIAEGLTNLQISEKLFISIDTVDSHRKNLYSKLHVKNTAMLIKFASENELL